MLTKPFYGRQFFTPEGDGGAGGGGDEQQSDGATPDGTKPDEPEKPDADGLTEAGRKAIKAERDARKIADQELARYKAAETKRTEDAAREQGDFKALYEGSQTTISERDARIAELEGQIQAAEHTSLRTRIAAKHKLPADLTDLLRGDDEAALEASAKVLAKHIRTDAPDTEAGITRTRQQTNRQTAKTEPGKTINGTQKVAWPT